MFQQAAKAAETADERETLFNAYLGIARSHAYGTKNHGAAAAAFDQAVEAAGVHPSAMQRLDFAGYSSQLHAYRVELEEALIHACHGSRFYHSQQYGEAGVQDATSSLSNRSPAQRHPVFVPGCPHRCPHPGGISVYQEDPAATFAGIELPDFSEFRRK